MNPSTPLWRRSALALAAFAPGAFAQITTLPPVEVIGTTPLAGVRS